MKKVLILLLAAIILISVVACTSGNSNKQIESQSGFDAQSDNSEILSAQTITFPVSDARKTESNTEIFDVEPFTLSMKLPKGWILTGRSQDTKIFPLIGVWSVMEIYNKNNEYVGAVGYNIYEEYEGAEKVPQAIYSQIALGNGYFFDARPKENGGSYTPISEKENGVTAITDVYYAAYLSNDLGYGENEKYNKGILSYNDTLLVYVAFEFDADSLSDEELSAIAQSIDIQPVQ